jgi:cellulose biosynthesis protein BcsQ
VSPGAGLRGLTSMENDVRRLLELAGTPRLPYRERIPGGAERALPERLLGLGRPVVAAFASLVPGAGATTLLANVAAALAAAGWRVAAAPAARADANVLLLDLARGPADERAARCDAVLLVLRPDEASWRALRRHVGAPGGPPRRARYLVNQLDARRAAHRQAVRAMRSLAGERVLRWTVQWDAAVARASAAGRLALDVAPASQFAADVAAIARALAPEAP